MCEAAKPRHTDALVAAAEEQIVEQSKRIDFYLTEYSIELLANKMKDEEFYVPDYQREFTWEEPRKSRFIESLLMGLPIPFLFFWENPDSGKLEIVDGSQRLRTIQEFVLGDLVITGLQTLSRLDGFKFTDLPESRQRKLKNRSIRGIVLNEHADEQSRFDLFDRINTGSKVANKAEVRRGALGGPFLDLVIRLAEIEKFIEIAPLSKKLVDERTREELVTRFFAYGDGLDSYQDKVAPFIYEYTKKMNKKLTEDPSLIEQYQARFTDVIDFVSKVFPWGFRRAERGTHTPKSRFEAIAIGSYLAISQNPDLPKLIESGVDWHNEDAFKDVVNADGANVKSKLVGRIEFIRDRLLGEAE